MIQVTEQMLRDSNPGIGQFIMDDLREALLDSYIGPRFGPPTPREFGPPVPDYCACEWCEGHPHGYAPESY